MSDALRGCRRTRVDWVGGIVAVAMAGPYGCASIDQPQAVQTYYTSRDIETRRYPGSVTIEATTSGSELSARVHRSTTCANIRRDVGTTSQVINHQMTPGAIAAGDTFFTIGALGAAGAIIGGGVITLGSPGSSSSPAVRADPAVGLPVLGVGVGLALAALIPWLARRTQWATNVEQPFERLQILDSRVCDDEPVRDATLLVQLGAARTSLQTPEDGRVRVNLLGAPFREVLSAATTATLQTGGASPVRVDIRNVIREAAAVEFSRASSEGTVAAWEHYLLVFPAPIEAAARARRAIVELRQAAEADWQLAVDEGSEIRLERFLRSYPDSPHAASATERIETIRTRRRTAQRVQQFLDAPADVDSLSRLIDADGHDSVGIAASCRLALGLSYEDGATFARACEEHFPALEDAMLRGDVDSAVGAAAVQARDAVRARDRTAALARTRPPGSVDRQATTTPVGAVPPIGSATGLALARLQSAGTDQAAVEAFITDESGPMAIVGRCRLADLRATSLRTLDTARNAALSCEAAVRAAGMVRAEDAQRYARLLRTSARNRIRELAPQPTAAPTGSASALLDEARGYWFRCSEATNPADRVELARQGLVLVARAQGSGASPDEAASVQRRLSRCQP